MDMDDASLADRYIVEARAHYRNEYAETAADILYDLAANDIPQALHVMDCIADKTDDQDILGGMGAGPLEDILNCVSGDRYVDEVIARARKYKNWRFAFGCVWSRRAAHLSVHEKIETSLNLFFPDGRP